MSDAEWMIGIRPRGTVGTTSANIPDGSITMDFMESQVVIQTLASKHRTSYLHFLLKICGCYHSPPQRLIFNLYTSVMYMFDNYLTP